MHLHPCLLLLAALLLPSLAPAQDTAPLPRDGGLVGIAECARCHDRQQRRLQSSAHGEVLAVPALPGCETCHGPGAAHAHDADTDPRLITLPPLLEDEAQTQLCGRCHRQQIDHHGGDPQGFRAAGLRCTDCHQVHGKRPAPVQPGVHFDRRVDADQKAEAVGSGRCLDCHPLREATLLDSPHRALAAARSTSGCERCHGAGALHAERGEGRFITRPDRADDGIATCRGCHADVDATEFHWRGRAKPYLSEGIRCTTCHRVHEAANGAAAAAAPASNRVCAGCHAAAFPSIAGSMHQPLAGLDTPLAQGCGSCHQGALAHAQAGGRRELLTPLGRDARAEAATCLQCHQGAPTLQHVQQGSHLQRGVGCSNCHGPLHGAQRADVTRTTEARCGDCHQAVQAQFALPNHHPVPEQRMHCASCHDVHGQRPRLFDLELTERRCVQCHARYRGPFVFAHQAQRRDGCVVCHLPHGSSNRRLLRQASTQQNCLQCHGDFPAFHDQTKGAVFTNCIRCHTEVHGSNHARYLLR